MHREIVDRAIAVDRLVTLLERRLRIGQEILVHLDANVVDRSDRAFADQLADVTDDRVLDVVVAEHGDLAGSARRGQHLFGIRQVGRHRLFAPDVLAGGKCRGRHLQVELVGRGDRNDVDLRVGDDLAPIARRLLETELGGLGLRQLVVHLAEMGEADIGNIAEHRPHRIPGERMALAHEAAADQADADAFHVSSLRDIMPNRGLLRLGRHAQKTEQKVRIAIAPNIYSILRRASKR